MLNYELARILMAERLRTTNELVRQGRLRRDLAEHTAATRRPGGPGVRPAPEPSQRAKPALG